MARRNLRQKSGGGGTRRANRLRGWALTAGTLFVLSLWTPMQPWFERLHALSHAASASQEDSAGSKESSAQAPPPSLKEQQLDHESAPKIPREILGMLDQRRLDLDKKEKALRREEARLLKLKEEVSALLKRHPAGRAEKSETGKDKGRQRKAGQESEAKKARLRKVAKMYEAMSPEEAAARIERMPIPTALKVLLLLKAKKAGSILGQVSPAKAAKLTQRYLSQK